MNTATITSTLTRLMSELVDGTPLAGGHMLNRGDVGLLRSLDRISADDASQIVDAGSSIAAHVDHVIYYMQLMNSWAAGETNPWRDADWTASWQRTSVTEKEWKELRRSLEREGHEWMGILEQPREVNERELSGIIASIAHLAYHLGAIRQMDRNLGGPSANNEQDAFTSPASPP